MRQQTESNLPHTPELGAVTRRTGDSTWAGGRGPAAMVNDNLVGMTST